MLKLTDGQCGLCTHFGGDDQATEQLVQIRVRGEAPEELLELCGHPEHAPLDLRVSAHSGCAGFEPVRRAG